MDHPSRDYEAGVDLPGLPVTSLRLEAWWSRDPSSWIARRVCKYLALIDSDPRRRTWILTGTLVGRGSDHEPLLTDITPIAWLSDQVISDATAIYHDEFDVGRTSVG
jgi:hypothetical protein